MTIEPIGPHAASSGLRQLLVAPRRQTGRPPPRAVADVDARAHPGARRLAEPSRIYFSIL